MGNSYELSSVLTNWTSAIFSHMVPLVIWCIVLILIGSKGVKYRRKMIVVGVWCYALSIIIPVLQYGIFEIMTSTSPMAYQRADTTALYTLLRHSGTIVDILSQCVAALSVVFPLLAVLTTDGSSGKSAEESNGISRNCDSQATASPDTLKTDGK